MELLLNGINGNYLRNILLNAADRTESVDVAVAYVTEKDLLFDWCWDNKIPLRFWGRFDEQVPVAIPVLQQFLAHRSGRYVCKLVRKFHPKVIWWRGYGAYIGSANITQSAWWNNVEAGVFLTEAELVEGGQDLELEHMFRQIDKHAAPLTQELFDLLAARNAELTRRKHANKDADKAFLDTHLVPGWEGLARVNRKSACDQRRQDFLKEWNDTLQIIRDIAAKISMDENRPSWVGPTAPLGAQADQFLHAHYYKNTFDGRRADFETHFAKHHKDPDAALEQVIQWWRKLPLSSDEHTMLNQTAPALAGQTFGHQMLELLESHSIAILEDGHVAPVGGCDDPLHLVHFGHRAEQRLLADHMLACENGGLGLLEMQVRRRRDVDHVDIVAAEQRLEVLRVFGDVELGAKTHRAREDLSTAIPPAAARAEAPPPSALGDALKRCQQMGEAATRDADCLDTWDDNRRRFLAPAGAH